MGLKFSKQSHGNGRAESTTLAHAHHQVINYLITNFFVRNLVSKKRRRLLVGGYDLDMSYITERILAMSFPAERMRAVYRNPLWQVKSVLDMRHQGHYKIYNLCIEETYDPLHFYGRVETYPFDDNHVPPLQMVKQFCESVHSWLSRDPKNVAVVHCMLRELCHTHKFHTMHKSEYKAGKGRTGLMVCTYLVYIGLSAEEALQLYAQKRTTNNEGVSIPSQRRYVGYWENSLSFPKGVGSGPPDVNLPHPCTRALRRIRLYDTVNTESIFFVISELQEIPNRPYRPSMEVAKGCCRPIKKGFQRNHSPRYCLSFDRGEIVGESEYEESHVVVQMDTESPVLYQKTCLDFYFDKPLHVTGDVRVIFYQKMKGGRLFYACFNTAFIRKSLLQFSLRDLDKVASKGRSICGNAFCLELLFGPANAKSPVLPLSDDDLSD